MYAHALDKAAEHLDARAKEREGFAEKYGANAAKFLVELPMVFRMYRRLVFDYELPVAVRHLAAAAALYIAEHQDLLDDTKGDGIGLIDDVYVGFAALLIIADGAGGVDLGRHWRGDTPVADVVGLARNVDTLAEAVPVKVRESADRLLGLP